MKMLGWRKDDDTYTRAFTAPDGNQHVIVIALVASGWSIVWQRGPGFTIEEASCFKTLEACVEHLWAVIFDRIERYLLLERQEATRQLLKGQSQ